jgi:K+-transporting ATPase A subunit
MLVLNHGLVAFKSRWKSFHVSIWHLIPQCFITNTNLQHYSGESGLSYLGQLTLTLWQFISAGCGMAICAAVLWL